MGVLAEANEGVENDVITSAFSKCLKTTKTGMVLHPYPLPLLASLSSLFSLGVTSCLRITDD